MEISFNEDLVLINLEAITPEDVIRQMAEYLLARGYVKKSYIQAVLAREKKFPTALPTPIPVSFPHTDVKHCLKPAILVGILRQPVKFGFMGDPTQLLNVRVVFMLSVTQPEYQVKALQRLIDLCQRGENIERILHAQTPQEVVAVLNKFFEPPVNSLGNTVPGTNGGIQREVTIRHPSGLHARPASLFVKTATRYPCEILVARVEEPYKRVSAKSILSVLSLGVEKGDRIIIEARGEQQEAAIQALVNLIDGDFSEEEKA
ncbi:MAG: HPr family phosphocarrier protein [Anaerolineae bacterium]|nr:HPr family phosphocarrier protein [Anaerolineae bacterium]